MDFTSSSSKPTTDPGLGPRPASDPPPPLSGARPHAVVVPPPSDRRPNSSAITPPEFVPLGRSFGALRSHGASPSSPSLSKDSVELLLEGMAGPRPDRRKTTPQSDGEASAAYHAEHGLRPARPSSEPGPKVVVERPVPASRPRAGTTSPGRAGRAGAALPGSREALSTFVPGRVLRRRVAMAILAGVLIVLLSFMGLRLTEERRTAAAPAVPRVAAPVLPEVDPTAPAAAVEPGEAPQPSSTTVFGATGATATSAVEPSPPGRASGGGTTRRHHHVAGETTPPQDDLGEFKSKF